MASDPVAKASSSESQLTPEDILREIEESYLRYVDFRRKRSYHGMGHVKVT